MTLLSDPGQAGRDLSLARARRLILAAIRSGKTSYTALTSKIAEYRTVTDRNRHRARKSKSPSSFPHAAPKDTVIRTAPAIITLASTPTRTSGNPPRAHANHPRTPQVPMRT